MKTTKQGGCNREPGGIAHLETFPKEDGESAMERWGLEGKSSRELVSGKADNSVFSEGKRTKVAGLVSQENNGRDQVKEFSS